MGDIFFTSDLHLGHEKILSLGKGRPFKTMEEMTNTIIDNWNSAVTQNDTVYVLGDVFWNHDSKRIEKILTSLNGRKILIWGNHDRITPNIKSNCWEETVQYKEIMIGGREVIMSHYPIFEWNGFYHKTVHFYGHVHGTLNLAEYTMKRNCGNGYCWDVGVDNNNFTPISFEEAMDKIQKNIDFIREKIICKN